MTWIASCHRAARALLPGQVISHAPQGPYLGAWAANAYQALYQQCPDIDFFFVQYYNQGPAFYLNYNDIFLSSTVSPCDGTAVAQLTLIPQGKIVVGMSFLQVHTQSIPTPTHCHPHLQTIT